MNFGTELKLKKEWRYNSFLTFGKGEIFKVALYEHKYGMKLHHPKISDLLDFEFNWMNRDVKIEEYFEVVETFDDRLAELEKVILDCYLARGYQVGVGQWYFIVDIMSHYKEKHVYVYFCNYDDKEIVCRIFGKTTKEMFDKAIEYFTIKQEN